MRDDSSENTILNEQGEFGAVRKTAWSSFLERNKDDKHIMKDLGEAM